MPKKGMKRPERTHVKPRNEQAVVPEIQGKAKSGKEKANPIVSGTTGGNLKVYHTEKPIPADIYPAIDTDLGRDNIENDIPYADLQDL